MFFGSFWHAFGYMNNQSNLENILKQENLTVETLLDTENVVNEIKGLPNKFSLFLKKNSHFTMQLIEQAISIPNQQELDEKKQCKYPFIASEIFGAQIKGYEEIFYDIQDEREAQDDSDSEQENEETQGEDEASDEEKKNSQASKKEQQNEEKEEIENNSDNKENQEDQQAQDNQEDQQVSDKQVDQQKVSEEETAAAAASAVEVAGAGADKQSAELKEGNQSPNSQHGEISSSPKKTKQSASPKKKNKKFTGRQLISRLLAFLDGPKPLNDTSAGYFGRILNNVISTEKQFFDIVEDKQALLEKLVFHITTKSIAEVVIKILSLLGIYIESDLVDEQKSKLLRLLSDKYLTATNSERESISYIVAEIFASQIQNENQYSITKYSPFLFNTVIEGSLIENVFKVISNPDSNNSSISNSANILNIIVACHNNRIRQKATKDHQSDEEEMCNVGEEEKLSFPSEELFATYLNNVVNIIQALPNGDSFQTSFGETIIPFGIAKLKLVELVGHIFKSECTCLINLLAENKIFEILMYLMVQYPWNNLLHIQIEKIVLEGIRLAPEQNPVRENLFGEQFNLLSFIAQNAITTTIKPGKILKDMSIGNIGFFVNLSKKVNETTTSLWLEDQKKEVNWVDYCENSLSDLLETQKRDLGGVNPRNKKEVDDSNNVELNISGGIYQKFTHYKMQKKKEETDDNKDKEEQVEEEIVKDDWEDLDGEEEQGEGKLAEGSDIEQKESHTQEVKNELVNQKQPEGEEGNVITEYEAHQFWKVNLNYNIDSLMGEL